MTRNGLLLRDYLPYKIGNVRGHISKVFEDKCLSNTSVSISGWRVLALVAVEKEMSGSDVVERSGMRKMAVSRAVSKLVDAVGPQEEVTPLLSVADVFLLPSAQESFGMAALEAMAKRLWGEADLQVGRTIRVQDRAPELG